ncbi:MAG: cation:proton antiporter [Pseudomonadota bacterium]
MGHAILRDVLVIFAVAVPVVLIAHRLRFPSIVGFLITGFVIGPHLLGLVPDIEEIRVLAEVGVALLLFSIGLEFSFERLKGWGRPIVGMGALQVLITAAVGFVAGLALGWSVAESAFFGCAIALSSTAIVMAVLSHKRWFDAPAGRIVTGILILQDLAVIPMMVLLKLLFMVPGGLGGGMIVVAAAKLAALALVIAVMSRWFLSPILRYVSKPRSKELFVVIIVGIAIGAAYATERMGLSFALGAFLAGLLVSNTDFRFHALSEIAPFRYCFNGLFFVSLGMIVDPSFIAGHWTSVALLVAVILIAKSVIVAGSVVAFGYPLAIAASGALMLAQVGEFSFMLVFFGWQAGVLHFDFYQLVVDASAITMVLAPFAVAMAPSLGEKLASVSSGLKFLGRGAKMHLPDEDGALSGHAVICGFGPLGMTVGKLLSCRGIPYVVLELNPVTADRVSKGGGRAYVGDGASGSLLHHSGVGSAKLLAVAVPDHLNAAAIIAQARRMNEEIYIITRSRYRDQVQLLYDAGADVVVCEELEGGIEMGRYILEELSVPRDEISGIFKEIRAFGSADFF